MAFTEFYMQSTGSNVNAGSTSSDSATYTQTNGSWDITADTFIATGGTPFSGVAVGDWVSIYSDGATVTPYISQVTAVYLSGLGVTLSTTVKFGTKTASGATGKSAKVGGAWASLGMTASSVALNTGTVPLSTRINVKAGTDAATTTTRTLTLAGATTTPLVWRGYKTTIGDMDSSPTSTRTAGTDIPSWTFTTGGLTITGAHQHFANLDIVGAKTSGAQVVINAGSGVTRFDRVRVENTGANAASSACIFNSTGGTVLTDSWFKATSTATRIFDVVNRVGIFDGCGFVGGGNGIETTNTTGRLTVLNSNFTSVGGSGILITSAPNELIVGNCTFSTNGADGVKFAAIPSTLCYIGRSLFSSATGTGNNNNTGTNTNFIQRGHNGFYNDGETGMGDSPTYHDITEVSDPLTSTSDLTLVAGALSREAAGSLFENQSFTSKASIGCNEPTHAGAAGMLYRTNGN